MQATDIGQNRGTEMKRTLIPFHDIIHNDFVIMTAWVESEEPLKVVSVEESVHFNDVDDMKRFHELLGKMIKDWERKNG